MENIEQENTQEVMLQEDNLLEGAQPVTVSEETEKELPQAVQLVQPKEAINNIKELERQYRETVERENR